MWFWKLTLCLWLAKTQGLPSTNAPESSSVLWNSSMNSSNVTANNTSERNLRYDERFPHYPHVRRVVSMYLIPLLLLFGTIGNVLSFIIYSQPAFSQSMTSFLFRVLAVTDTMALNYGLWNNWLVHLLGRSVFKRTPSYCKVDVYLRYLLPDIPVWVLVLVSVERVIGVTIPHRARVIITKRKLIATLAGMVVFLMLYNCPVLISYTSSARDHEPDIVECKVIEEGNHIRMAMKIFPWMDLVMYALLPLSLMFISSIIIISIIMKRRKFLETRGTRTVTREANALTVTLLMVCLAFMLLTLPHTIYALIVGRIYESHEDIIDFHSWWLLVGFLRYVNNAINFFLYCLSGRPFRRELCRLFRCNQRTLNREYSAMSTQMSVISKTSSYRWQTVSRASSCHNNQSSILTSRVD